MSKSPWSGTQFVLFDGEEIQIRTVIGQEGNTLTVSPDWKIRWPHRRNPMKGLSIAYLIVSSICLLLAFGGGQDTMLVGLFVFVSFILGFILAIMELARKQAA